MRGLVLSVEVPYFACFRRPTTTSVLLSFPIPPPSTIFGMLLNALGVESKRSTRPYFHWLEVLQDRLKINISPSGPIGRPIVELAKMLKLIEREVERKIGSFPSSPIFKEFLVRPSYEVFLASEDEELLGEIAKATLRPARPLYIGQSDDMVVVDIEWSGEVKRGKGRKFYGLVRGAIEGCEMLRLPFGFKDAQTVLYLPLVSLPQKIPVDLGEEREGFEFDGRLVELFGVEDAVPEEKRRAI